MISTFVAFVTRRLDLPPTDREVSAGIGTGAGGTKFRRSTFDPSGEQMKMQFDVQVWSSKREREISWCCKFGSYQHTDSV